jgi:hypothetical protein
MYTKEKEKLHNALVDVDLLKTKCINLKLKLEAEKELNSRLIKLLNNEKVIR